MQYFRNIKARIVTMPKKRLIVVAILAVVATAAIVVLIFTQNKQSQLSNIPKTPASNAIDAPKPRDWSAEKHKATQAEQLIAEGKLDEAAVLLNEIDNSYPEHSTVTSLLATIEAKRTEAARTQTQTPAQPKPSASAQPASKPVIPAFSTPITIRGDEACQADTVNALQMIANAAPEHYVVVTRYISVIECVSSGSAMYAYEKPPRYAVGDQTRSAGTLWYASTIVHDANHSRLYHEGKEWTGGSAENICLDAQASSLSQMGAPQSTIDYVNSMKDSPYWQTPVEDRYW